MEERKTGEAGFEGERFYFSVS